MLTCNDFKDILQSHEKRKTFLKLENLCTCGGPTIKRICAIFSFSGKTVKYVPVFSIYKSCIIKTDYI